MTTVIGGIMIALSKYEKYRKYKDRLEHIKKLENELRMKMHSRRYFAETKEIKACRRMWLEDLEETATKIRAEIEELKKVQDVD